MAYAPGHSGNPAGRPAGTPNNVTAELRQFIQHFIDGNRERIQADFDELDAKDRLAFIEKLLKYVLPRQLDANINTFDLKQITGMQVL